MDFGRQMRPCADDSTASMGSSNPHPRDSSESNVSFINTHFVPLGAQILISTRQPHNSVSLVVGRTKNGAGILAQVLRLNWPT